MFDVVEEGPAVGVAADVVPLVLEAQVVDPYAELACAGGEPVDLGHRHARIPYAVREQQRCARGVQGLERRPAAERLRVERAAVAVAEHLPPEEYGERLPVRRRVRGGGRQGEGRGAGGTA